MPKAAAAKPAKKEKKVKDPNAPKKPLGSYMFFCAAARPDIRKAHPTWTLPEVAKALGEAWGKVRRVVERGARRCSGGRAVCGVMTAVLPPCCPTPSPPNNDHPNTQKVSDTDKKKYEKKAAEDKDRYAKEMAAYEKK